MAPKVEAMKMKKRKRDTEDNKQNSKNKSKYTNNNKSQKSGDGSKVKFQKPKQGVVEGKNKSPYGGKGKPTNKIGESVQKQPHLTKMELRKQAKERTEARKKRRKPHYTVEQELALLWEKMRKRNTSEEDRSKFISEALQKIKGKVPEIAGSHVSSRVLQTCVKYCSHAERDAVYEELRPQLLTLATNTYAVHLITKMLENASKTLLSSLISLLHGHVASLLRHTVGSVVVEEAYRAGNASQRRALLMELYSTELQLFKDLTNMQETRLVDIISKLELKKASVLRHMTSVLQPILEKGILDHSIIHKALIEYLSIADKVSAEDVVKQLCGALLVRMIHTRDGARIGMLCVKHGSAKERKKLLKGMKSHVGKIALDRCGSLVLVSILSTVDDTKLVTKVVIHELQQIVKDLVVDKSGRLPLLQLLHPDSLHYFSPDDLTCLNSSIPSLSAKLAAEKGAHQIEDNAAKSADNEDNDDDNVSEKDTELTEEEANETMETNENTKLAEGGKKDPLVRRQELLIKSGLAESLVDTCIETAEELLKSNSGKDILYEVATGGADGILHPTLDEKLVVLHEEIANLVARPKSDESEHLLESFYSSRTLRKLVLDCPPFASVLWKTALEGKAKMWAKGHSAKVVSAFVESSDPVVRGLASKELKPLVDKGVLEIPEKKPVGK